MEAGRAVIPYDEFLSRMCSFTPSISGSSSASGGEKLCRLELRPRRPTYVSAMPAQTFKSGVLSLQTEIWTAYDFFPDTVSHRWMENASGVNIEIEQVGKIAARNQVSPSNPGWAPDPRSDLGFWVNSLCFRRFGRQSEAAV
jgi:hypothetical protein